MASTVPLRSVLVSSGALLLAACPAHDERAVPAPPVSETKPAPAAVAPDTVDLSDPGDWPENAAVEPDDVTAVAYEAPRRDEALARPAYGRVETRLDPERVLVSIAKETLIRATPAWDGRRVGYLRAGAVVARQPAAASTHQCPGGWYGIEPEGFVCVGKTASLDPAHPIASAAGRRPDRDQPMPYVYARSRFPTPPFYVRIPTREQQARVELDLAKHRRNLVGDPWKDTPLDTVPDFLAGNRPVRTLRGYVHSERSIFTGRARPDSGFAFVSLFESDGRRFGLTVDMDVVPLDRVKPAIVSELRGVEIDERTPLPVVFVRTRHALLYSGDPKSVGLQVARPLRHREVLPITGKRTRLGDVAYYQTLDGHWLRDEQLTRIDGMRQRPGWATPGRTWIDVSILRQTLVAYVGDKPVYATLVSTGADGLGDPAKTHSTVRGQFLIHTKHVTATMSSDEVGEAFDLRDVPYVQYFTEGYAFHAAYWHDDFGKPRSHGCINLAPADAQWLFEWTDPPVPDAWHGAMTLHDGTLVNVHP